MEAQIERPHDAAPKPHHLAEVGVPYRFTPASGAELAKRRWDAERQRKEGEATAKANPQPNAESLEGRALAIQRKVKQMAKFDDMIDEETDAKELHMLTASRERIFREWCALTRNPISGTFKAMPEKSARQRPVMSDPT